MRPLSIAPGPAIAQAGARWHQRGRRPGGRLGETCSIGGCRRRPKSISERRRAVAPAQPPIRRASEAGYWRCKQRRSYLRWERRVPGLGRQVAQLPVGTGDSRAITPRVYQGGGWCAGGSGCAA
eukprot:scaffold15486_cov111-Isochrysis_galbana.AAC.7